MGRRGPGRRPLPPIFFEECTDVCFGGVDGQRKAEFCCSTRLGVSVISCRRRANIPQELREGFACVSDPVTEVTEGPLSFPSVLEFPQDVVLGGTFRVEVTISVDDVSSASREDYYFLADATESMREEIETTKNDFQKLIDARSSASGSVAFGVGYFRDEKDRPAFKNVQRITEDFSRVRSGINSLQASGGGGDEPEANLYALSQVATSNEIGWRQGTRKVLVYFGDAPGHEPTCPFEVTLTRRDVIRQLNRKGIAVVATNFGSATTGLNAPTFSTEAPLFSCGVPRTTKGGQGTDIARGTKGVLQPAGNPTKLFDVILGAVESLDQELSVVTNNCAGKVDIKFDPKLPIRIAAGETKTIIETATILPGACRTPQGFTCEIEILLSGVGVKQVIQTTHIAGCVEDDNLLF